MRQKADQAALEADKLVRIRREQGAIDQLRRDIKAQLDALGQSTLAAYHAGEITHPQLASICQQIDALNEQIAQREARIEQIRVEKLASPPIPPTAGPSIPCPNCRQWIPAEAKFCPSCGHKIPPPAPAGAVCTACGSPMPAGAQFCPACGARRAPAPPPPPTPPPPQTIRCTGCGAELPAVAVFCPDCGTRVSGAVSYAPPPERASEAWRPPEPRESPAPAPAPWASPEAAAPPDLGSDVEPWSDADQASAAATKRCVVCETELPIEAVFCPECGARQQVA
jgi:rRNA maturation endonuclease Nob1